MIQMLDEESGILHFDVNEKKFTRLVVFDEKIEKVNKDLYEISNGNLDPFMSV